MIETALSLQLKFDTWLALIMNNNKTLRVSNEKKKFLKGSL